MIKTYTIGFTQTSAEKFFFALRSNKINKLVDVRLNNVSQLAGFAKKSDLIFFLKELCGAEYLHEIALAPTKDILDPYKKGGGSWEMYEEKFINLMEKRSIEKLYTPEFFTDSCLLCSEKLPHHCHRKLVVDYLNRKWESALNVKHLT